jgi:uncharacterized membrane protein (UPF0127 family)
MMRGVQVRVARLAAVAATSALLATACGGSTGAVPTATPTPSLTSTVEATTTPSQTATATATATPTPTPTPEPRFDDIVASTTFVPLDDLDVVEFTSEGGNARLSIEVPAPSEYGIGLSGRYQLGERGMLFYYPEGNRGGFWMRNTHIDLDIAFVDSELRIIDILRMEADTETIHQPDATYIAAIEAPAGWYERASIEPGDDVEFLFDVQAAVDAAAAALE